MCYGFLSVVFASCVESSRVVIIVLVVFTWMPSFSMLLFWWASRLSMMISSMMCL